MTLGTTTVFGYTATKMTDKSTTISVVVPMYNEELVCDEFFKTIVPVLENLEGNYEIICINDGSDDGTADILRAAHEKNERIKIISLTRNFGKELALTAGIDFASGDAVIPIDADLQDPPDLIPDMIAKWKEGYDVVLPKRKDRASDTIGKKVTALLFYKLITRIGEVPIPSNVGDFRLMDRRVVQALKTLPERTRFMKGLFAWLGFRQVTILYSRQPRAAGETKWHYWKLWNFALEGIFSFSTVPLKIWTYFGTIVAFSSLVYMSFIIVRTLVLGIEVPGYASLTVFILFFSGINMIGLGILGEYVGRMFIEVKQRPLYLIRDMAGIEPKDSETYGLRANRNIDNPPK